MSGNKKFGFDGEFEVSAKEAMQEFLRLITYDEISEVAAYCGFPVRYPHWWWGMEYEELARYYAASHHVTDKIVKDNPVIIVCCDLDAFVNEAGGVDQSAAMLDGDIELTTSMPWPSVFTPRQIQEKIAEYQAGLLPYFFPGPSEPECDEPIIVNHAKAEDK